MTLEELKAKYTALSQTCAERGNSYDAKSDEKRAQGNLEEAGILYGMATEQYKQAMLFIKFVNDLNKVTK